MKDYLVRPARKEDFSAHGWPIPDGSLRALTMEVDGELYGIAGVKYGEEIQGFSYRTPALEKDKRAKVKFARAYTSLLKKVKAPVVSLADPEIPKSEDLLIALGFRPVAGRVYLYDGVNNG